MLNTTLFSRLLFSCAISVAVYGQDRHDWQSVARLHSGDRVRVVLKTGPVEGEFQSWTPQELRLGTVTAKREDVVKIERHRHGGSRAEHAALGAMVGLAGGFVGGEAVPFCVGLGPCGHQRWAAEVGGAGAVIGALAGAALPTHSKELIYSSGPRGSRTSNQTTGRNDGGSLAAIP